MKHYKYQRILEAGRKEALSNARLDQLENRNMFKYSLHKNDVCLHGSTGRGKAVAGAVGFGLLGLFSYGAASNALPAETHFPQAESKLVLPQSALMTFARQKEDGKKKLADSLEIITFSDSTSSKDSSSITNAKDSIITVKKKMRLAQNPLGVNLEDFFALSPQDSAAYVDSLKAKMDRILPHRKYRNDTRETYQEWLAGLEDFMQKELQVYKEIILQGKEIEKEKDSIRMENRSDTLRLLPDEFVLEMIRLFPEADGSHSDAFFKRAIAHRLLKKYTELVKTYDFGTISALDSALADRIDVVYANVYDSTHNAHSSKRNDNVKFRDLLMYYIYDVCANESYGSYKMSVDVMSSLTAWAYNPEEKKSIIASSVKAILAKFYEIRLGTVEFGWLLQTHRAPKDLSIKSLYKVANQQDVYERAEKLLEKISGLEMEISYPTGGKKNVAEKLFDLGEDMKEFMKYVKEKDQELGKTNKDESLEKLCGWIQDSYDQLEKSAKDKGLVK